MGPRTAWHGWVCCATNGSLGEPSEIKKKKFCNRSCSASYNNKKSPKRRALRLVCLRCGEPLEVKRNLSGRISKRKYCDECLKNVRQTNSIMFRSAKGQGLGKPIDECTKGEIRALAKTFQYYQIYINRHARKIYELSGKSKKCEICGYNLHTEICHIKDVKDFSSEALISEINNIDNLVALCRNHHWEFDHNYIEL